MEPIAGLPIAFRQQNNRWKQSWTFWMLSVNGILNPRFRGGDVFGIFYEFIRLGWSKKEY